MNPNDQAYPSWMISGLTKRELFAAMAMQGMIIGLPGPDGIPTAVRAAVTIADALIAELSKPRETQP